jgi:hypothetical protein
VRAERSGGSVASDVMVGEDGDSNGEVALLALTLVLLTGLDGTGAPTRPVNELP